LLAQLIQENRAPDQPTFSHKTVRSTRLPGVSVENKQADRFDIFMNTPAGGWVAWTVLVPVGCKRHWHRSL